MDMSHDDREHMRRHRDDVDRIVAIAAENGYAVTPRQAYRAWADFSESSCAGWMMLDDYVWENVGGRIRDLVD